MTARDHLETIVRPNVAAMDADYDDRRMAFNAVASVDALAAAIFADLAAAGSARVAGIANDDRFRDDLAAKSDAFSLVRDIAKAQRHGELTRLSSRPQVIRSDDVDVQSLGYGEGTWNDGRWGGPPQVVATTQAGEKRVVDAAVTEALAFLEDEMRAAGL